MTPDLGCSLHVAAGTGSGIAPAPPSAADQVIDRAGAGTSHGTARTEMTMPISSTRVWVTTMTGVTAWAAGRARARGSTTRELRVPR